MGRTSCTIIHILLRKSDVRTSQSNKSRLRIRDVPRIAAMRHYGFEILRKQIGTTLSQRSHQGVLINEVSVYGSRGNAEFARRLAQ